MELINQTLIMAFVGVMAASGVVFPILFLVQRKKHHKDMIETLKNAQERGK